MADRANKIAAIFGNTLILNQVLDELNQSGFNRDEISVLMKNQTDGVNDVDTDVDTVRTYSTGSYPSATLERPVTSERMGSKVDRGLDRMGDSIDRGLDRVGLDRAGDSINRGLDRTGDALNRDRTVYDRDVIDPVDASIPGHGLATPGTPITGVDAGTAYNNTTYGTDYDTTIDRDRKVYGDVRDAELVGDKVNVNRETDLEDTNDVAVKDPNALMKDSMKGGALGLLAGAAALLIPGIGPVFAAGPIAAAIGALATGAAVGTTAGALVGLFKDEGIPSDRVDAYRAAFDAGKAVIIVKPKNEHDEMTELNLARSIFNRHNPEMVELIS
jgi:hypothetical protein